MLLAANGMFDQHPAPTRIPGQDLNPADRARHPCTPCGDPFVGKRKKDSFEDAVTKAIADSRHKSTAGYRRSGGAVEKYGDAGVDADCGFQMDQHQ
jgi:hypothetical protein